jgi:hypothetical protein
MRMGTAWPRPRCTDDAPLGEVGDSPTLGTLCWRNKCVVIRPAPTAAHFAARATYGAPWRYVGSQQAEPRA